MPTRREAILDTVLGLREVLVAGRDRQSRGRPSRPPTFRACGRRSPSPRSRPVRNRASRRAVHRHRCRGRQNRSANPRPGAGTRCHGRQPRPRAATGRARSPLAENHPARRPRAGVRRLPSRAPGSYTCRESPRGCRPPDIPGCGRRRNRYPHRHRDATATCSRRRTTHRCRSRAGRR